MKSEFLEAVVCNITGNDIPYVYAGVLISMELVNVSYLSGMI
jgi:hypothetical protein